MGLLAIIVISICAYLRATQVDKIFAPRPDMPSNPERMGMDYFDVLIPLSLASAGNSEQLHAFWVPAENLDTPVILYLHGQDATRGKNLEHTENFHQCGYHVLVIDYRGFAESYGEQSPNESKVYEDASAALNYLLNGEFSSNPIFIYGHSLGGAVAIDLATRTEAEGTAGLTVESTFTSIHRITGPERAPQAAGGLSGGQGSSAAAIHSRSGTYCGVSHPAGCSRASYSSCEARRNHRL
jgi:pimeloyl-ACP methyl ester carboxylesterase